VLNGLVTKSLSLALVSKLNGKYTSISTTQTGHKITEPCARFQTPCTRRTKNCFLKTSQNHWALRSFPNTPWGFCLVLSRLAERVTKSLSLALVSKQWCLLGKFKDTLHVSQNHWALRSFPNLGF